MSGVAGNWECNLISEITVRSSIHQELPSFSISMIDGHGILTSGAISDQSPVYLEMGDGNGFGQGMNMRCIGGIASAKSVPNGVMVSFNGVLDNIAFLRKTVDKHYENTTAGAAAEIAGEAGLGAQTSATSDKQIWLPNRKPLAQFIRMLADHSWVGAGDAIIHGVSDDGTLKFRSISDITSGGPSGTWSCQGGVYNVPTEYELASKAVAYNQNLGYAATTMRTMMDGTVKEISKTSAPAFSALSSIGSGISDLIGSVGKLIALPVDCGNVHDNFTEAPHNNKRIKSTFSADVNVMLDTFSGNQITDLIYFEPKHLSIPSELKNFAGNYIFTAKVMTIQNGRYAERNTITTQGY
jgi:hypothetical protein